MAKSPGQWAAEKKIERSRQERIDKAMCRPGYSWNETLQKCLPPVGYGGGSAPDVVKPAPNPGDGEQKPAKPANPGVSIAVEGAKRAAK